jgi:hypothetical protein
MRRAIPDTPDMARQHCRQFLLQGKATIVAQVIRNFAAWR